MDRAVVSERTRTVARPAPRSAEPSPRPHPVAHGSLLELPAHAPGMLPADRRSALVAREIAGRGLTGTPRPLPFRTQLEEMLGTDLKGVKTYIGGPAAAASEQLQARAYTYGERIAFRDTPDRDLAAHEAVHVLQQRHATTVSDAVSEASDPHEHAARAFAQLGPGAGLLARVPITAPVPAIQRDPASTPTPEAEYIAIVEFWYSELQTRDPGPHRAEAYRIFLLLNALAPDPGKFATADDVDKFEDDCKAVAKDEQQTYDKLTGAKAMDDQTFIAEGEAFPGLWADRVHRELYGTADESVLVQRYTDARRQALASASTISDAIWDRGLPVTRGQAAQLERADIPELVLDFDYAREHPKETLGHYTTLLVSWARTLAHYYLVHGFRWMLKNREDEIRKGQLVINGKTYQELLGGARFIYLKIALFANAASSPDDMRAAFTALMLQTPTKFFRGGLGGGLKYQWPSEGIQALWSELQEVDSQLAAAGRDGRIWRAMTWAYERDYFGDDAVAAYQAIKNDWPRMIATAAGIIIAQAIPGVDVAIDIVLLVEFGLDVGQTLLDLKDAFVAAAGATKVEEMQRASSKMARTLVGTAVKIVIWAATWGVQKVGSKITSWREAKAFLEEEGHSAEAKQALIDANGDAAKAREALEVKRARERAAAAKKAKEEAARAKREQEEAARKRREQAEAAARKQRELREQEAARKAEQAKRKPGDEQRSQDDGARQRERRTHVHQGEIETDPQSPYFGKWNGGGVHDWNGLQTIVQRDGYKIEKVTEDPKTHVRRVDVRRIGVDPATGQPVVGGVIRKTIYPKDLTAEQIDLAGQRALDASVAHEPGSKLVPPGDGGKVKKDGTPVDGFFEATVTTGDPPRAMKVQGWYKEAPDGTKTIMSHAPAYDKNWPELNKDQY